MRIALIILWIIWCIPSVLYIIWKRGDWYLFIIPPIVFTVISLIIAMFSEVLSVIAIIAIHIFLFISFLLRIKK